MRKARSAVEHIDISVYGSRMRLLTTAAISLSLMIATPVPAVSATTPAATMSTEDTRVTHTKKKKKSGKACPAKNFWVGAGWGADRGRRTHMGIDLGGKRGAPIFAVEAGRIDRTKRQSNGALQIVLKGKSGSKYYYGHMDKVLIRGGQKVKKGQVIGRMGDTGSPGEVHLHFEYWKSGRESDAINPHKFIKRVCKGA